jgi:hypothetical protein
MITRCARVLPVAMLMLLPAGVAFGQSYRDYNDIAQLLLDADNDYPAICRRVDIGDSEQNRPIWALNISDNVGVEEDEPEFKYISTMHGDEWTGNEMLLYLIDELLTNYGTDPQITNLIDELDIWIVPVMNPDGFAIPRRGNINFVDLNRDFPDLWNDPVNTTAGRAEETATIMNWSAANSFTAGANIHTGALVANYPYDASPSGSDVYSPCPDDDLFVYLCEQYSQHNTPMWNSSVFFHGITNGADWYVIYGGMQDWNYHWMGCNEITLELSNTKIPSASQMPTYWSQNRDSMLAYMDTALIGVRGIVTDALTGSPLAATVRVTGRDHDVFTDPDVGDYHRMLLPGTYELTFSAPGFAPITISNVVVSSGPATVLNVAMTPPPSITTASPLPGGTFGLPYGPVQFAADGGTPPLTWSLISTSNYVEQSLGANAFAPVGTAQGWNGDDSFWNYTLPFAFPFYGVDQTVAKIWSNGFVNFGASEGSSHNNSPALLMDNVRIAPLWDDLRTNFTGKDIYIDDSQADRVTIRWDAVTYSGQHQVDFAVTLFDDGAIEFHYGPSNTPVTPTVGVSRGDSLNHTLASYDAATALTSVDSLRFEAAPPLPQGMSLLPDGTLTGTPQSAGTFSFAVRVTDDLGRTSESLFELDITASTATGDYNADGHVDLSDFAAFQACGSSTSGACGSAFEFIADGTIDLQDYAEFMNRLAGPMD